MYDYTAKIISVHDRDTCRTDLGSRVWAHGVDFRMFGINAPELKTPDGPPALAALLTQIPPSTTVRLETFPENAQALAPDKVEKFGRWLARVWVGPLNVNQWM